MTYNPAKHRTESPVVSSSHKLHILLEEIGELHDRKQKDYGMPTDPFANVRASAEWCIAPWVGAMIRLTDKVKRLQALLRNGRLANESAFDSLKDIAVYALIAHILLEEEIADDQTNKKRVDLTPRSNAP